MEFAYTFHKSSPRKDEPAPNLDAVVAYFERKAIPYSDFSAPPLGDNDPGRFKFAKIEVGIGGGRGAAAIAALTWLEPRKNFAAALLACDMRYGGLYAVLPDGEFKSIVAAGSKALFNPCHVEPCDLDGDDIADLVVADLGQFYPTDERFGRVVGLMRSPENRGYQTVELASGLGRVADVQPGDFDGDGDQDLIVAEFGLYEAGRILLLENRWNEEGTQKFIPRELDPRHGTVCVPTADLNGDGRLDFVALISQEHEVIEAFLNCGEGKFETQRVYAAPNPSWGSSGLQLVDMDADGDLDLLYSNGDSFDRQYLKPYHALRWLENQGEFPWAEHHLMDMPGCQRALAGDMDRDGDLDILAVALLPTAVLKRFGSDRFDSICWLEQTAPGEFHRRSLERGACNYVSLALADLDADGDLDAAVGEFNSDNRTRVGKASPLVLLRNETQIPAQASAE